MEKIKKQEKSYGLIRNYGWKKNLLIITAGFFVCAVQILASYFLSDIRGLSEFDPAAAVIPFVGFALGMLGTIGYLIGTIIYFVIAFLMNGFTEYYTSSYYFWTGLAVFFFCVLPPVLWYLFPLKDEKPTTTPRLTTSAHVIKYYLIMLISVAVYVVIFSFPHNPGLSKTFLLDCMSSYAQYIDAALIFGIPLILLASLIRNKTLTINERMVLSFLIIGVAASAIGAFLLYRNTLYLEPSLFENYEAIFTSDSELSDFYMDAFIRYIDYWNWYFTVLALLLNALLIIEMLLMHRIEKKITRPILHLANVLDPYTELGEEGLDPQNVKLQCRPYQNGFGEVSSLTRTCVNMVEEIDRYTENLRQATAEKERIGTELDVASRIQKDMLPGIFPPFPDREELDLFASMTPAREVGGDFYDFYFIDHDHIALTIADVSGKGIPASLFMVISKTLLKSQAHAGISPKEILTYVNHQLCENNSSFMFCTVWFGILDVTNGLLTAANAGHEYPAVKRSGGEYELLKSKHDPPLGLRDGLRYHEYELTLSPGDCLFQYTDGVTEATSSAEELFGEERLVLALNEDPDDTPEAVISRIYRAIGDFVKEAPPFDDTTMLCLRYRGRKDKTNTPEGKTI